MDYYNLKVEDLPQTIREKIDVVPDLTALQHKIAVEFAEMLEEKTKKNEILTIICPVGPLDYRVFVSEIKKRGLTCKNLRTINMDDYLDKNGKLVSKEHPMSFRRFMDKTFFSHLNENMRPKPENIIFPDPDNPGKTTELIDAIGGADICWAGFGITGHIAFNDPPRMLGEPDNLESFRNSKTRKLTISPMSNAQMAMGGTNGNFSILPKRAITLGMSEILKSKKIHLTFMRSWHAGVWRRALLDCVTQEVPGSLVQEHADFCVTMTELAAAPFAVNPSQSI